MSRNHSHSKCPKCENTRFEMVEDTPNNSNFKMYYIRCISCKTIVGTHDYDSTESIINQIVNRLKGH